ncbi:hypothetical protein D3C71_1860240 [compost metagenome]
MLRLLRRSLLQCLECQPLQIDQILAGDFAFTTFPRVKLTLLQDPLRVTQPIALVVKAQQFGGKVVTPGHYR